MRYTLENEYLLVEADENGAELTSIRSKKDFTEYLWQADERYWRRHAPVLFPIVGSLSGKKLVINGADYPMGQHGFARDKIFKMVSRTDDTIWFALDSDEEIKERYPYDFRLEIGYILKDNTVKNIWRVTNTGDFANAGKLHYQIGGHPAFNCPLEREDSSDNGKQSDYFFRFGTDASIRYRLLNEKGLLVETEYELATEGGYYKITDDMFDKDALIVEGSQTGEVSICLPDKRAYLTVIFDSPLFGLWSPAGKNAPFVCIEPWFGRADRDSFAGDIADREYDQVLEAGESKEYSFTIRVDGI